MNKIHLTSDSIRRAVTEFPNCIECGNQYFHKPFCQRGAGLSPNELVRRLKERVAMLLPDTVLRCHCGELAIGTAWVADHKMTVVIEARPVCDAHTEFDDDRPHGVMMEIVTKDTTEIQRKLAALFKV